MRHIPSLSALKAFEAAGRHASFLGAANELNLTPGAISRQIRSLEEFIGKKFFERGHKQVHLTALGRDYLAEIKGPLGQLADASRRIREFDQNSPISICAYPTFAIRWLIPRWSALYDQYPNIDIRLTTSLNVAEFASGHYDLTIQVQGDRATRDGLMVEKLMDVDTFPVCAPALAETILATGDLAGQTLLHAAPRVNDWKQWLDFANESEVDANSGLKFESTNLALHAAIEGLGVAIGIEALIQDELASGQLVRPFDSKRRSHYPIQLVYPGSKTSDPLFKAIKDWLQEEAEKSRAAA
ncbi:MAG: LysR family transcriptional regulator [Rhodospirillaceae bacterium]|jgi:LysR family transcriptional regulator, glycine cleavage system transcriptional activator|nr:LysR family transcriptional regulator [Rhodospirillaceae bacterium]MBT3493832.1 LysR family transcriptional regulator [Rhodospirillaceae bacterium]MBT3779860.1 LysR family transcriptional regulator [Rhodospirillaceae bacterium]MBT3977096.1 LysR family transcriptional regulator [Rhodospirillaceae bacterium]MBT4563763.1 LysR family transcriptional regulator [Rhodospirillaceae bacterium]